MRRVGRLILALVTASALQACATMNVSSHVESGVDFARYRTFDWGPADSLPTGDPRLDKDPFFKDQLQGAVERGLAARGIRLAASGATPDLRIHYHANVSERIDISGTDQRFGACQTPNCQGRVDVYEASTIVLDVVDTRTNRIVWRGWAQEPLEPLLNNRDRLASRIQEAVRRMLAQMPKAVAR